MPYIPQESRDELYWNEREPETAGELNYKITSLVNSWIDRRNLYEDTTGYTTFNAAIGVLECAKAELYRRRIAPYEDQKAAEFGDVYS